MAISTTQALDLDLIEILKRNPRQFNTKIAAELGKSEAWVRKRISRLVQEDVIRFVSLLDVRRIGYEGAALIALSVTVTSVDLVAKLLKQNRDVQLSFKSSGRYNVFLVYAYRSVKDLHRFVSEHVNGMPGISTVEIFADVEFGAAENSAEYKRKQDDDLVALVGGLDIFSSLPKALLALVSSLGEEINLPEGCLLVHQGKATDSIYGLVRGKVEFTVAVGRRDMTFRVAEPGECFPVLPLLKANPSLTSARTVGPVTVVRFPYKDLLNLLNSAPEIGIHVYQALGQIAAQRSGHLLARLTESAANAMGESSATLMV